MTTVFAIRRFYKQRDNIDAIDTGSLVRHATAFALFLVAAIVFNLSSAFADVFPSDHQLVGKVYFYSNVFYAVTSFISQVLLCTILWTLGTDVNRIRV